MSVKVDGNGDLLAESAHQLKGGVRLAQPGHVFDGQKMSAKFFQPLGHAGVVLDRIFGTSFIENIAGVADGRFANRANFQDGVDTDAHVFDRVERIKDAEDVDPLRVGLAYEFDDDVVSVGGVTDSVGPAQQHLKTNVGDALA